MVSRYVNSGKCMICGTHCIHIQEMTISEDGSMEYPPICSNPECYHYAMNNIFGFIKININFEK